MTHARSQIRAAFIVALTGTTSAADIIDGGVFPVYDNQLPAISVQVRAEEIDEQRGRIEHIQYRSGNVVCTIYAKELDDIDNQFDLLSEEIETAVFNSPVISDLTNCLDLVTVDAETTGEGEKQIGIMTLTFAAKYMTEDGKPGVIL